MARSRFKRLGDWFALRLGVPAAYVAFRAIGATLRRGRGGASDQFVEAVAQGQRFIAAFWHDDSFHMALEWRSVSRGKGFLYVMASPGRDGELMARFLEMTGARAIRGSTTHGGGRALVRLASAMGASDFAALAVDGSRRCARFVVQSGVLLLARRTGLAILPVAARSTHCVVFGSHKPNSDRIEVPLPFSATRVLYGEPLRVPDEASESEIEKLRLDLEERLRRLKGLD